MVSHRGLCLLFDEVRQFRARVHGATFSRGICFARLLWLVSVRLADIFTCWRAHIAGK